MRTLMAIGHIHRDVIQLARFCAVSNHWMTPTDHVLHSLGAPTVMGCCDACAGVVEIDSHRPTDPAAA